MIPGAEVPPAAAADSGVAGGPPAGTGVPNFQPSAGADNDPTVVPDARTRELLSGTATNSNAPKGPVIPLMFVRARVFVSGQPPVAILWVGGREYTVREGTELHFYSANAAPPTQMKVSRITSNEIRLDLADKSQFITLD
jgi:hypothetical protein